MSTTNWFECMSDELTTALQRVANPLFAPIILIFGTLAPPTSLERLGHILEGYMLSLSRDKFRKEFVQVALEAQRNWIPGPDIKSTLEGLQKALDSPGTLSDEELDLMFNRLDDGTRFLTFVVQKYVAKFIYMETFTNVLSRIDVGDQEQNLAVELADAITYRTDGSSRRLGKAWGEVLGVSPGPEDYEDARRQVLGLVNNIPRTNEALQKDMIKTYQTKFGRVLGSRIPDIGLWGDEDRNLVQGLKDVLAQKAKSTQSIQTALGIMGFHSTMNPHELNYPLVTFINRLESGRAILCSAVSEGDLDGPMRFQSDPICLAYLAEIVKAYVARKKSLFHR